MKTLTDNELEDIVKHVLRYVLFPYTFTGHIEETTKNVLKETKYEHAELTAIRTWWRNQSAETIRSLAQHVRVDLIAESNTTVGTLYRELREEYNMDEAPKEITRLQALIDSKKAEIIREQQINKV